jgi:hypothetical protein
MMGTDSSRFKGDLDSAAELVEPAHESPDLLVVIAAREVIGTQIAILDAVLEQVPGRNAREHAGELEPAVGGRESGEGRESFTSMMLPGNSSKYLTVFVLNTMITAKNDCSSMK